MNGNAGLSEAELDQLVDYTAGALTGADEERIARLVETDDRWAIAHAEIGAADAAVSAALRATPPPGPMPADIVARLDSALGALGPSGAPADGASTRPRSVVLAFPVDRARRRRLAMTIAGVAAAAVAVVGGVSVAVQLAPRNFGTATSGSADRAESPAMAGAPDLSADASKPPTIVSGLNYQPDSLGQLAQAYSGTARPPAAAADTAPGAPAPTGSSSLSAEVPGAAKAARPGELQRLAGPAALDDCLAAIGRAHAGSPRLVDYASFEGRPAVLVLLVQGAIQTVVVVGPECGLDGADEWYATNVG